MKSCHLALLAAPLLFLSCENPADKTPAATVTEAVGKTGNVEKQGLRYSFTPKSEIKFVGSKITKSHNGGFTRFDGHFTIKDGVPVGDEHRVTVDMSSVYTDDEKLTADIKSDHFFDIAKYPESKFELTKFEPKANKEYIISGNLTLHGETKNITFPATVTPTGGNVMIYAKFNLNRKQFGIVYPGLPDDLIRDEVVLELKMEATPEAASN